MLLWCLKLPIVIVKLVVGALVPMHCLVHVVVVGVTDDALVMVHMVIVN